MPERIEHDCLPATVLVAFEPLKMDPSAEDLYLAENKTGARLIRVMASDFWKLSGVDVITQKNEKPEARVNGEALSVSFSHTKSALAAAISRTQNVGCDMEAAERNVHPRLARRMRHNRERDELYANLEPIRIWTLKEAALKMIGTGLRRPMNSIRIDQTDTALFAVDFCDGKAAKICSFHYKNHWLSVCYQDSPVLSATNKEEIKT